MQGNSPGSVPKKILRINFESEYDFLLVGLLCAYKDYRLCFELNQVLKLNFLRKKDVILPAGKPGSQTRHSYFNSTGRDGEGFHVLSNRDKDGTGNFIPEMKNIDYFLLLTNTPGNFNLADMIKSLRTIDIISGAFETDPAEMKSADAFLLFLEG